MGKYFISMTKAMGPIPNTHKEKSWGYGSVAECAGWTIMQTCADISTHVTRGESYK